MNGNDTERIRDGRKGMQKPSKIKDVKNKIHARTLEVFQHGVYDFALARGRGGEEIEEEQLRMLEE